MRGALGRAISIPAVEKAKEAGQDIGRRCEEESFDGPEAEGFYEGGEEVGQRRDGLD